MLLDFKSNIYGFLWAYFEFWYWADFWALFIPCWAGFGLVLSCCLAAFVSQTWQPWLQRRPPLLIQNAS